MKRNLLVLLFFGFYLIVGLLIFKDYGMSYDEHWGRENGVINAKFMAHKLAPSLLENKNYCPECPSLTTYPDVDHGPVFEIATTFLEWVFGLKTHREIFYLRHLCSFLLFYVSTIFFYLLLQQRFRQKWLGLAGVFMLVISPRIFAESFYNAKDIPFLSLAIICSYTLSNYLRKKNIPSLVWHALACGIATDIRILGLLFPVLTVAFTFLDLNLIRQKSDAIKGESLLKTLGLIALYLALVMGFIILFWPYLWEKPFLRFPAILQRSGSYPWLNEVLYLGKEYIANQLPWHYLPVWLFISIPLVYMLLALTGLLVTGWQLFKSRFRFYQTPEAQLDLAMAAIFLAPIIATILLKLVIYDAWRHMYFLYAGLVYMAVLGLATLYNWFEHRFTTVAGQRLQQVLIAIWLLAVVKVALWMVLNHPFQNVYFSIVSGEKAGELFERDYWGLSYRQGLLFLLKESDQPEIKVCVNQLPGLLNQLLLAPEERKRLKYVPTVDEADYFLSEYRRHPSDYPFQDKEIYSIKVDGLKIMSVFKLK